MQQVGLNRYGDPHADRLLMRVVTADNLQELLINIASDLLDRFLFQNITPLQIIFKRYYFLISRLVVVNYKN